jgi:pimeloyl-ACP methyl ester carboxylesterase
LSLAQRIAMMEPMSSTTLPPAIPAERREIEGRSGRLAYYVAGRGPPLLLVHSINAAGSAREVRPAFEHAMHSRRVYAPDLPGYGFSDRSPRRYDVALFCDAIRDMLRVIAGEHGRQPVDALGLSLSAEFLARVAADEPSRFRSLTLVTPTGFRRGSDRMRAPAGTSREVPGLHATLTFPLWRGALFGALVSRASIRYFLERTFGSKAVDDDLVDYAWRTTHQPGAQHAPYAFLSGRLFSADIRSVYERLELPVWLAHGTRGDFSDFSAADWLRARPNWTVQPFETGALVYFELPAQFFERWDAFLSRA